MKRYAIQVKQNGKWFYTWSSGVYGNEHYIVTYSCREDAKHIIASDRHNQTTRIVPVNLEVYGVSNGHR